MLDRLQRAADSHIGDDTGRIVSSSLLAIKARIPTMEGPREGDVLRLVAASIVLANNLGYSLETILAKLEETKEVR